MGRRTLTKGVSGSFLRNLSRRRNCGDHIYTLVGGRLPNLVSFGCKFKRILDILPYQVGVDVLGQVVKEEALEHKKSILVNSVTQGKQAAHLAHQDGWVLIRRQGEGHQSLVPLERVQGVEFCEVFLEGLIGVLRRELDEIQDLG